MTPSERERWFAATLESIGDAVIASDPEGMVTFLNPVAETMTGWPAGEASGRAIDEVLQLFEPGTERRVPSALGHAIHHGFIARGVKLELVARDGARRLVDDSASAILDAGGNLLGGVVVLRDVSEQVTLEKRLSVSERLAALGTLAAGVAHEINNPLSYILMNLELSLQLLAEGTVPSPEGLLTIREMLTEALDGTARVGKIVDGMRRLAPADPDARDLLRLPTVIEAAVRLTHNSLAHRARLVCSLGEPPLVRANEGELVQVLTNLLLNAAQAIDEGRPDDNEIRVSAFEAPDGRAVVEVRDTGRGIPADSLYRVFDPFFSTRGPRDGAGLGLAISQTIVAGYGGTLDVESEVGQGSLFRVTLPASISETPVTTALDRPSGSTRRGNILIVDDEPAIARGLQRMLGASHDVTVVSDGEEALALTREQRFDVVFCDLMMTGLSGMEFHERLMNMDPDATRGLVFMTGGAFTPRAEEFLRTTPNRCLAKPFQRATVEAVILELLDADSRQAPA
jgi:PAS domain S-box-containing protein